MATDQELMARSRAGDPAAFDAVVQRHQGALFRHLLTLGAAPTLAEDLCQDAFLRLYRALPRFDQGRPVAPFLFKIATNLWRDNRKRADAGTVTRDLEAESADCAFQQVADRAVERLERAAILEAVARLRWEYRAVISLRYDQGLSYREIAQAMRVSVGTVAAWLHRAVDELRSALAGGRGREVAS
jgi:RNA polymerase sigma-70 factor (ECF subfamily)